MRHDRGEAAAQRRRTARSERTATRASGSAPLRQPRSRSASRTERSRASARQAATSERVVGLPPRHPPGRRIPRHELRLDRSRAARRRRARGRCPRRGPRPTAAAARRARRRGRSSTPSRRGSRARRARPCAGRPSRPTRRARRRPRCSARSPPARCRRPAIASHGPGASSRSSRASRGHAGQHRRREVRAAQRRRRSTGPPQCSVAPPATASSMSVDEALDAVGAPAAARSPSSGRAGWPTRSARAPRDDARR